jgi:DNA-binding YbaB/EbfC family protein
MKDLAGLMQQAQDMQKRMTEAQARLEDLEVVGESGAGLVQVTLTAKGHMRGVKIDPSLMDPAETEVLEDLLKAAHDEAKRKADEAQQTVLAEATKGMGLPPGIDLPFGIKP